MYRLWAKTILNNKTIKSIDVTNNENITLEEKRKKCFDEIFYKLDLSYPIYLDNHNVEFKQFNRVIFKKVDFVDEVDFDKLEIDLIDDGLEKKK